MRRGPARRTGSRRARRSAGARRRTARAAGRSRRRPPARPSRRCRCRRRRPRRQGTGAELGEPFEQPSERLGPSVRRDADAHRHRTGAAVTGRSAGADGRGWRRARSPSRRAARPRVLASRSISARAAVTVARQVYFLTRRSGRADRSGAPLAVACQRFQPVGEALGVPRRDQQVGRVQLPENLRGLRLTGRHNGQPAGQIVEQLQGEL